MKQASSPQHPEESAIWTGPLSAGVLRVGGMLRLVSHRSPPSPGTLEGTSSDPLLSVAAQARDGDAAAERTLLRAVAPNILQVVRSVLGGNHPEIPDVCQEACLALLQALPRFRAECTVVHFACRIAVLSSMNARRRDRLRKAAVPDLEPETLSDRSLSPANQLAVFQRRQALRSLLDELPESQAAVLAHHVMLGHTIEETARAQGTPVATVRSRLRYALNALRRRVYSDPGVFELIRGGHD